MIILFAKHESGKRSCGCHHGRRPDLSAPVLDSLDTREAGARHGRARLPLLLWRIGLGRGGPPPFSVLGFVATFHRVDAPMHLAGCPGMTASSPCPSPPAEGRGLAPHRVSPAID